MKGAEAKVVAASFFQFYKASDHIKNVEAAQYLLYGVLGDQTLKLDRQVITLLIAFKMVKSHRAGATGRRNPGKTTVSARKKRQE